MLKMFLFITLLFTYTTLVTYALLFITLLSIIIFHRGWYHFFDLNYF